MYKNPIFGDIIPQKTINSYSNNIFPKFVKILQICKHFPHNIFPKNSPYPFCCYSNLGRWENHMGRWGVRRNCSWLTAAQKVAMSAVSSSRRSAWAKRLRQKRCIHTQKITSGM